MELIIAGMLVIGFLAGSANAIKKCDSNHKWCQEQSAKIKPAPEQKSDGE